MNSTFGRSAAAIGPQLNPANSQTIAIHFKQLMSVLVALRLPSKNCLTGNNRIFNDNVSQFQRIDVQWVLSQHHKIGELTELDCTLGAFLKILPGRITGNRAKGGERR